MSLKEVKLDKKSIRIFSSFAEADADEKRIWHEKSPKERLEALELMRQSAFGYEDSTAGRLQRILEVIKGK